MSNNSIAKLYDELRTAENQVKELVELRNEHQSLTERVDRLRSLEQEGFDRHLVAKEEYRASLNKGNQDEVVRHSKFVEEELRKSRSLEADRQAAQDELSKHISEHGTLANKDMLIAEARARKSEILAVIKQEREQDFGKDYIEEVGKEQIDQEQRAALSPEAKKVLEEMESRRQREREEDKERGR